MENLASIDWNAFIVILLAVTCLICGIDLIVHLLHISGEVKELSRQRVQVRYILENWGHDLLTIQNLNTLSDTDLEALIYGLSRAKSEEEFEEAIRYHIH